MATELTAARRQLQAAGLTVRVDTPNSLWIASQFMTSDFGVRIASDACAIQFRDGGFVAVLPSLGHQTIEIPGGLPDLVSLILSVYLRHRQQGGAFRDAVQTVLEANRQFVAEVA